MNITTRLSFFILAFLFSFPLLADDPSDNTRRGIIVKTQGQVLVVDSKGIEQEVKTSRRVVSENETIVTRDGGFAVVHFNDGSLTVLDEKSRLRVEKTNWLSYLGGKVYFTFRKVFGKKRQVKSPYATLGIRGTTFIIDEESMSVSLQEGTLDVESPGENFEIHHRKEMDEFEAFRQEYQDKADALASEYNEYVSQMNKEFVEYKKEFVLEANHVIQFDGNRVDESTMSDKHRAAFEELETFAGEALREFRETTNTSY